MIELGSNDPDSGRDSGTVCGRFSIAIDGKIQRCVIYLSIVALALTSLGYDPFLRVEERKAAEAAEAEAAYESFYAGLEEEADEDADDIEINYQPNLYLARILTPCLTCWLITKSNDLHLVNTICGLGHLAVSLFYMFLMLSRDVNALVSICGFISEIFWAGKIVLYYYQILSLSDVTDRYANIIYGVIAQSFGASLLPWIVNSLEESWEQSQHIINIAVALIHLLLFHPFGHCEESSKQGSFEANKAYKFQTLVSISTLSVIILSAISNVTLQWFLNNNETLLRSFLPFFVGDDAWETFWNVVYHGIAFTFLGFFCIFLSTSQVLFAAFLVNFLAGTAYLYLEEDIAARLAIPTGAFTFATALALLAELCPRDRLIPLLGIIFVIVNTATYGYFGLLTLFWSSPDIVIIVVWAANGFFALILAVLWRELSQLSREDRVARPDRSGSFRTVITTIS
ncbi:uncharacterized protein LOC129778973 [Toxorhynchites rutilus septentrionalis]|uniref:uncharacterized protein LOC129778973 n=1 Tax=Toxorhynchites rutilus septentrionalis TaxID=329112 RepID=UPI0024783429|nr:uncharacterized protein LOC129778973 [Toxorhynchites rutilus septentrionalis]